MRDAHFNPSLSSHFRFAAAAFVPLWLLTGAASLASAQGALHTVRRALDGETQLGDDVSQALRQLAGAARSLNALADYLERHPEALLRGKQGADAK